MPLQLSLYEVIPMTKKEGNIKINHLTYLYWFNHLDKTMHNTLIESKDIYLC